MELITSYTAEEEQLVIQSALQKKKLNIHLEHVQNKHFTLRCASIRQYFMRSSFFNKKKCILKFVKKLRSPANTFQILSNLSLSHTKMEGYSFCDPKTNNVHHTYTLDHDRMLETDVFSETLDNDVDWFQTLDDEKQFKLIMTLLQSCNGAIKRTLYMPLFRIFSKALRKFVQTTCISYKTQSDNSILSTDEAIIDDPEFDPKHPASMEVTRQRKRWYDLITKYRSEVMPELLDECNETKEKKQKDKNKNGTKDNQAKIDCELDLIQLLPIWIVKKILGYFDIDSLNSFKKINSYWAIVSQEIIKERKARESINEYLENMKQNIDPNLLKKYIEQSVFEKPNTDIMGPHTTLVAVDKSILPKDFPQLITSSLRSRAKPERQSEYDLETGEMIPFPRVPPTNVDLYQFRSCFLQDVDVKFDLEEETERQKSFLTYSLSGSLSSLKISVDENILTEW